MMTTSTGLKMAAVVALVVLAGCTTKPAATTEAPPAGAPPVGETSPSVESNIIPGSAQDLRVNVQALRQNADKRVIDSFIRFTRENDTINRSRINQDV